MATYKTTGLVLRRHNLGEADRIISFLTPDHGKLRAVARGVRKIKSRQAGHLELFCETELMLANGRNLDVVTSARLKQHWPELNQDFELTAAAYLLAEMIDKLIEEEAGSPELYRLTIESYATLAGGVSPLLVELYFKIRLLDVLGYRPELGHCLVCGHPTVPERNYFLEPSLGGVVDQTCRREGPAISPESIKLWRLALVKSLTVLTRTEGAQAVVGSSLGLLDQFYLYVFGKPFRSKQLLSGAEG